VSADAILGICEAILAHRDGVVAVIEGFIDESGIHEGSPAVAVAAYLAEPADWHEFSMAWQAKLSSKGIRYFHAADCAALRGEFEGWDVTTKNEFVAGLLPLIGKLRCAGVAVGIVLRDFEAAIAERPRYRDLLGTPYTACFHWVVQKIIGGLQHHGDLRNVALFHEINDHQHEALDDFQWIRLHRDYGHHLVSLAFGTKEQFVPLQAADVLAYETFRRISNASGPPRRAMEAIHPKGEKLTLSLYDKRNMASLISVLDRIQAVEEGNPC
jgi:hypothetical protein